MQINADYKIKHLIIQYFSVDKVRNILLRGSKD
jgi:hypothetical protein